MRRILTQDSAEIMGHLNPRVESLAQQAWRSGDAGVSQRRENEKYRLDLASNNHKVKETHLGGCRSNGPFPQTKCLQAWFGNEGSAMEDCSDRERESREMTDFGW